MGNELVKTKKANVIAQMAAKYSLSEENFLTTLKGTIMRPDKTGKEASNEELTAFLMVANQYELNPFTKEIYAFCDKRAGIIPIVGVDGFIRIANRDTNYDGYDLIWAEEQVTPQGGKPCPEWCEIKVYRKDREHPMVVREYLDEVYQAPRGGFTGPWQTHTKRMLRHKTIIQGVRVAFGLSGIYDEDEAERIIEANTIDVDHKVESSKPVVAMPVKKEPEAQTETKQSPKAEGPAFICSQCQAEITEKVHKYSKEKMGAALCFTCQKGTKSA